ncbi:uncharacterized protein PFL1_03445 [Pseudozyma flocculosa PF-1]|uniref:FAD/NAD(P)-binding domain-containing protein n=2 Tax=Pseudozyma flocculosa TaxID=84751 RepID=A0A5C3FBN2_9BASI|nr:uncharacterized protein PFL1_03445 [Pseudozyma flocculosa PF-1]EPQ29158.1 hypothetical protein PFL1_03445 [Pseudozyma flocculosa PF-1]SPO41546.1 uncharacterized protein PSFLO_07028 [Pseudozyma flocculosa]
MAQPIRLKTASSHPSAAATASHSARESSSSAITKNVVVLGGSYGGMHAATVLAQRLPPSHRLILIERNSHFNHLYVFPRFSVLPGHEHKAFIPYTSIFKNAPARPSARSRAGKKAAAGAATPTANRQARTINGSVPTTSGSASNALEMGGAGAGPSASNSRASVLKKFAETPVVQDALDGADDESLALPRGRRDEGRPASGRAHTLSRDSRYSSNATLSSSSDSDLSGESQSATASTMASSFTSNGAALESGMAGLKDPGNKAIEAEIANSAPLARREEELGRPEMEITELSEAIDKGLDVGQDTAETAAGPDAPLEDLEQQNEEVAEGFEESAPHVVLQATVTDISPTHITVTPTDASDEQLGQLGGKRKKSLWSIDSVTIPYTHLVYALGSHLPDPLRTDARFKRDGINWMREIQQRVKASNEIVLVGGGALGVEFATDIASIYPHKSVTLIHSRKQLLPNFDERVHELAYGRLKALGVNVILGERLALTEGCPRGSTVKETAQSQSKPEVCVAGDDKGEGVQAHAEGMCVGSGRKLVKTTGGRSFECDLLLLCTGQQPNSSLMANLSPSSVDPSSRLIRVHRTLQVAVPDPRDAAQQPFDARPPCGDCDCFLDKKAAGAEISRQEQGHLLMHGTDPEHEPGKISNVYAIGDCADAFGALNAGYQAWGMADIAAENILRDIEAKNAALASALSASSSSSSSSSETSRPSSPTSPDLVEFNPPPNMLKLSLGLGKMVAQGGVVTQEMVDSCDAESRRVEANEDGVVVDGKVVGRPDISVKFDPDDLGVEGVWSFMANVDPSDMHV